MLSLYIVLSNFYSQIFFYYYYFIFFFAHTTIKFYFYSVDFKNSYFFLLESEIILYISNLYSRFALEFFIGFFLQQSTSNLCYEFPSKRALLIRFCRYGFWLYFGVYHFKIFTLDISNEEKRISGEDRHGDSLWTKNIWAAIRTGDNPIWDCISYPTRIRRIGHY